MIESRSFDSVLGGWKVEHEASANGVSTGFAVNGSMMALCDLPNECEAQAAVRAGHSGRPIKTFENSIALQFGHAATGVGNNQRDPSMRPPVSVGVAGEDLDVNWRFSMAKRILQQVS